ncbi:NACHT domain-containing protein [Roseateles sp. BYS78W]|uniref:NACHT domain-containing protein n=1 Tax=Pelomonas candidula TaxID=3299025 RepID=A0ABW7HFB9_9BURK
MSDKKEPSGMLDAGLKVFDALWSWSGATDMWRWTLMLALASVCILIALYFLFKALTAFLEVALKCIDAYKASGLPLWLSREEKIRVRRRAQFCSVLKADLAYIAKAESWNDQYFTDLEAEVETDGGYYANAIHKLIRKKSFGLRKEKSLLKAIASTSERAVQLTGEPGAGKSVALRHLATQLAERGIRAKDKNALVPLYVNLREIVLAHGQEITADSLRSFIIDNVRRGDSDTSDFVKSNWDDYRDRGVWFFLFDSFDEIPEILHAEKGSPAAFQYSEAIRQFLDGMGACKGILASREFKGPEALPWKKFRILSLSVAKQEELVANSFLTAAQAKIVLLHLSSQSEGLAHTPLFLTLLCRYVRDEGRAPENDYQLLSLQIEKLAKRDPAFLLRQYSLTPDELIAGSERIARAFAEESSIGLSPSFDQMAELVSANEVPGSDIRKFIAAMVDCKIARADVPNAAPGDRRFAFAHRRYQEALFVRHLVKFPEYISPDRLLIDPRWREYTVTLLETQPINATAAILNAAISHLNHAAATQRRFAVEPPASGSVGYFGWRSETIAILELLQEGLSRRIDEVPDALKYKVADFLMPRWNGGDSIDRTYVVRLGALLPQKALANCLIDTFNFGSQTAQSIAFGQTFALRGTIPEVVRTAVLERLAAGVLKARDRAAVLRLEALVARLPPEVGARHVFKRCLLIKTFVGAANSLVRVFLTPLQILALAKTPRARLQSFLKRQESSPLVAIFAMGIMVFYVSCLLAILVIGVDMGAAGGRFGTVDLLTWLSVGSSWSKLVVAAVMALAATYLTIPILYAVKAHGDELGAGFFLSRIASVGYIKGALRGISINIAVLGGLGLLVFGLGRLITIIAAYSGYAIQSSPWIIGILPLLALVIGLVAVSSIREERQARRARSEFSKRLETRGGDVYLTLLEADDIYQVSEWLYFAFNADSEASLDEETINRRVLQTRSLSAILSGIWREGADVVNGVNFAKFHVDRGMLHGMMSILEIDCSFYSRMKIAAGSPEERARRFLTSSAYSY